ncbi:MAG: Cobalamin import ATP-binding protein BtuD [Methanomassiliicoccales archaeon PtaB.Bin134]|jgi:iron complex transport system ATP-binding protein|nr:MAG: Cobalamin import ATP-binding protein BtuD [Methanomassiliicoccales archaeon PtaB.Bin134]
MLTVKDICFSYREKPVLENIDLEVRKGEIIGILGPNGCGKTTLLKLLNRNLHPRSGRILMEDQDLEDISKRRIARHIAVVPQSNEIRFAFSVRDIVSMGRMPFLDRFQGESSEDMRIVEEAMEKTNIREFADRLINTMSGGERQRVIIARALAQRPEVILLDEPTLHLDINHQFEVLDLVKRLSKEEGLTVIIVSHDLPMVVKYCDRMVLIHDHRVHALGTPEEVLTTENMRTVFNIDAVLEYDDLLKANCVKIIGSCRR